MTRIVFMTSTMQGAGHLARAYAVYRGLARRGDPFSFTVIAPASPYPIDHIAWTYVPVAYERDELRTPQAAEQSAVAAALRRAKPDIVIVDMFWLPLFHVRSLTEFGHTPWWLLLRNVPPTWLRGSLTIRWNANQYDRVIGIEPIVDLPTTHSLSPVVGNERLLPLPEPTRDTLIAHVGMGAEFQKLCATFNEGGGAAIDAHTLGGANDEATFPLADRYPTYRRIIGGGGYNFVWETVWAGVQDRTRYVPFERPIDDQKRRIAAARSFDMKSNGADDLAHWLLG